MPGRGGGCLAYAPTTTASRGLDAVNDTVATATTINTRPRICVASNDSSSRTHAVSAAATGSMVMTTPITRAGARDSDAISSDRGNAMASVPRATTAQITVVVRRCRHRPRSGDEEADHAANCYGSRREWETTHDRSNVLAQPQIDRKKDRRRKSSEYADNVESLQIPDLDQQPDPVTDVTTAPHVTGRG